MKAAAEANAATEANAAASVPNELLPPLPTHAPANDNAEPGDPIADLLEDGAVADDAVAEEPPVAAQPQQRRRRVIRRSRRDDWRRNYGPFGGLFGGR